MGIRLVFASRYENGGYTGEGVGRKILLDWERRRVEIRLHFCVPVTKVGGYMEESLNRGFCLIGGRRRVEIRLHFCSISPQNDL